MLERIAFYEYFLESASELLTAMQLHWMTHLQLWISFGIPEKAWKQTISFGITPPIWLWFGLVNIIFFFSSSFGMAISLFVVRLFFISILCADQFAFFMHLFRLIKTVLDAYKILKKCLVDCIKSKNAKCVIISGKWRRNNNNNNKTHVRRMKNDECLNENNNKRNGSDSTTVVRGQPQPQHRQCHRVEARRNPFV